MAQHKHSLFQAGSAAHGNSYMMSDAEDRLDRCGDFMQKIKVVIYREIRSAKWVYAAVQWYNLGV